jgi:hypothetical protein
MTIWITPAGFLGTVTERVTTATYVEASGTNVSFKLISGSLPTGMSFNGAGRISGVPVLTTATVAGFPSAVLNTVNSKFVIRATQTIGTTVTNYDRTFNLDVSGPSAPTWNTDSGYISAGYFDQPYVLNNSFVDFTFSAGSVNSPEGTVLTYYVADGDGILPPGLTLDQSGRLYGFVKDKLTFDGDVSPDGGYDTEAYDGYTYDHASTTSTQITGVPKFYKFYITADDGVASSKRLFSVMIVNPNMFKVDNTELVYNTATFFGVSTTITSAVSSLQIPQFLNGTDLGTVRAGGRHDLDVRAFDPNPYSGPVRYSITEGNNPLTQLPTGLYLDRVSGYIYGYIPYQPAYTRNYSLTIHATKYKTREYITATNYVATATNVFTLSVEGQVETTIQWVTTSSLGTIYAGEISEVAVKAEHSNSSYNIKYVITNGRLPSGLVLREDGSISGRPEYNSTGTYTFTVLATDVYGLSAITRTFNLGVSLYDSNQYTQIYVRPFLPLSQRTDYQSFIGNTFTFDPALMYRFFDSNFGVQQDIKMYIEFGIEKLNLSSYMPALTENFYRKKLYFGDIKLAVAKDSSGNVIYEAIYVDIVDTLVNNKGVSVGPVIYNNDNIYYPNSVDNMRSSLEHIVLPDYTYIGLNKDNLPRYMNTAQAGDYKPTGYMRIVPICYALPGQGSRIISRIKLSGFDFKKLNFEVDRLIIQNSLDSSTAKYVIFARQSIADKLPTDDILFGPEYIDLDTETGDPLTRA